MVIAVRTERGPDGLEVVKQADTDTDRARLRHEADMLRRAAQPGVVEVIAAAPGVLRLRHRGTALARLGPLAPDQSAAIVRASAEVVDALHRQGIAHNRISGDHVVIGERGRPRLCGFGDAGDATDDRLAADVADLGRLLDDLLDRARDALWSPAHRGVRNAARRKRALSAFRAAAASARRDDPGQRPTARQFATALHDAFPELALPDVGDDSGEPRAFAEIPTDFDPTSELGWTDDDLWYLAELDRDGADGGDEPERVRGVDPYASLAALSTPDADVVDDVGEPRPRRDVYADLATEQFEDFDGAEETDDTDSPVDDEPDEPPASPAADPLRPIEIRDAPPRAPSAPPPDRRIVLAIAAIVLVIGAILGVVVARAVDPFSSDPTSAVDDQSLGTTPISDSTPDTSADVPTPPTFPAKCDVPPLPGPDLDGDGCPEPVTLADRVATVGTVSVELGQDGDLVTLADPDCDGVVTPVVYRPSSGEVFVFSQWSLDQPSEVPSTAVVPDGRSISTRAGQCGAVTVTTADGAETVVAGPGA